MRKKRRNYSRPVSRKSVSVRCPNCQTLWRCYGMRRQTYYTCVICNHRFKLLQAWLSDWSVIAPKSSRRIRRLARQPRPLEAA